MSERSKERWEPPKGLGFSMIGPTDPYFNQLARLMEQKKRAATAKQPKKRKIE